ncbi:MAG TPA: hypothetical protein DFR83_17100, partial [Deltaproteobacteria bacterium]|nr:hypothetical protein [Deltaproteobacteria bacterium]
MRFFDEAESETVHIRPLGRGEAGVYDAGYTLEEATSQELLGFQSEDIEPPQGFEEDASGPARIFVGRAAVPSSRANHTGDLVAEAATEAPYESASGPIETFSDDDQYDDQYDDFDDDPAPTPVRAPPSAPGMRLLTPEREETLNTDRAWPGLLPRAEAPEPAAAAENRPSWLDSLSQVQHRADEATASQARRSGRAWDAPLLDFKDEREHRSAWAPDSDREEDVIEAGDEEDAELPVHQPMSYGEDGYFSDEPLEAGPAEDEEGEEGVTGKWNRLAVLSSGDSAESPKKEPDRFGVAPSPVWKAQAPAARSEQEASPQDEAPWGDVPAWFASEDFEIEGEDDLDPGPALPPIHAMGSVLQQEINTRKTMQPKAVVLKTLDGVSAPPTDLLDEPSDLRSRVPGRDRRGGLVDSSQGPRPLEASGGYGRVLLLVAVAVMLTVATAWKWGSMLPAGPEAVPLQNPGESAPVAVVDSPGLEIPAAPEVVEADRSVATVVEKSP